MSSSNSFLVVNVYPNCRIRNNDNDVTFEYENPILLRTWPVSSLAELKSLILGSVGGSGRKEIGRVGYRLLALMENRVFRFRLFWLHGDEHVRLMFDIYGRIVAEQVMELSTEVGDVGGGGGSGSSDFIQDDPPLAPPPIHVASPVEDMEVDGHYSTLDLNAMHEKNPLGNTSEEDYNLDSGVDFRVGHRIKSRDAVVQGVKNYSIRRSVEYRVVESDRLKYHVRCRQHAARCPWSLRVTLR
ncbi:hypothetical protein Ahy_B04g070409 isoform A [Arachis hypogaea]|uniref:Transposase MuDR plant domain-containing protein n=1 Tax=Arachis hypogaea TaxID=3818 RepID=A0A444ZGR8_ARAHY|nr:hypothetical protein Ahy_B04g070409 isoform A [Arachis hypogaea]